MKVCVYVYTVCACCMTVKILFLFYMHTSLGTRLVWIYVHVVMWRFCSYSVYMPTSLGTRLSQFSHPVSESAASVHLPRVGHTTPNFNWYGTERLIRKHLASRGIPSYMYPRLSSCTSCHQWLLFFRLFLHGVARAPKFVICKKFRLKLVVNVFHKMVSGHVKTFVAKHLLWTKLQKLQLVWAPPVTWPVVSLETLELVTSYCPRVSV